MQNPALLPALSALSAPFAPNAHGKEAARRAIQQAFPGRAMWTEGNTFWVDGAEFAFAKRGALLTVRAY